MTIQRAAIVQQLYRTLQRYLQLDIGRRHRAGRLYAVQQQQSGRAPLCQTQQRAAKQLLSADLSGAQPRVEAAGLHIKRVLRRTPCKESADMQAVVRCTTVAASHHVHNMQDSFPRQA